MIQAPHNQLKEVEVLDAMCGTGKTYALFKYVSLHPLDRYIYVTPMLREVESRAAEELAKFGDTGVVFEEPTGKGYPTKHDHALALLQHGHNVICTHALFLGLGQSGVRAIRQYRYTVIADEEMGMIEPLSDSVIKVKDRKTLIEKEVVVAEADGRLRWKDPSWGGGGSTFDVARKMTEDGSLYATKDGSFFNVQVPVELLSAAKRVIIATYQFEGSILDAFLRVKGIQSRPFSYAGMQLRDERMLKQALRERILFVDAPNTTDRLLKQFKVPLDDLREKRRNGTFSSTWYAGAKGKQIDLLSKHVRNIARQMGVRGVELMYTLPSSTAGKNGTKWLKGGGVLSVQGFSPENCFLHKGARATNDYDHKTAAIHLYNRYPHPAVTTYLNEHGAKVDPDAFALAELIQWFFRCAIRKPHGPKVQLHIASPRMDYLFKSWLMAD